MSALYVLMIVLKMSSCCCLVTGVFAEESILLALQQLGMKSSVTPKALLESARLVGQLMASGDVEAAVSK